MRCFDSLRLLLIALLALVLSGPAQAVSTDLTLFSTGGGAPPNILMLLDTPGSMNGLTARGRVQSASTAMGCAAPTTSISISSWLTRSRSAST